MNFTENEMNIHLTSNKKETIGMTKSKLPFRKMERDQSNLNVMFGI